jgi:penicillin-binding protein 1A
MSLTQALTRSINTIAVKLSISIGNGNPKAGRAKIVQLARNMGLRTPLADSTSLPIGAAEVTVLDHTVAYAAFPNGGKAVAPHTVLEVRTAGGEVIWRFDRDGPKPRQVMSQQIAADMNMMMNKVTEEGTARRALIPGVRIAGKTGTTNAYRDAWFVGYSGNIVGGVWVGNDDYSSTNRMTGGSLPAMTWQAIMSYAHQGIEIKPLLGVPGPPPPTATPRSNTPAVAAGSAPALRPTVLTVRGADVLVRIERLMDDATRALGAPATVSGMPDAVEARRSDALASASGEPAAVTVRGN